MKGSKKWNNTLCICRYTILLLGFNFQVTSTNLQTFDYLSCMPHAYTKFHNVLGLELIFFNILDILDIYRAILSHKENKMRFFTFMLIKQSKV